MAEAVYAGEPEDLEVEHYPMGPQEEGGEHILALEVAQACHTRPA